MENYGWLLSRLQGGLQPIQRGLYVSHWMLLEASVQENG